MASATTTRIYELQVKLAQQSLQELKKLERGMGDVSKKMEDLEKFGKDLAKTFLAGVSIDAFVSGIAQAIEKTDALAASAEKIGVSVETFSALAYAAEQSDVEIGDLEQGLIKLEKAMSDSGSAAGKMLKALNVDPNQSPEKVLQGVADALKDIKDPAQQTGVLLEIFGKSGAQLKPLLAQGGEGIAKLTEEAAKLGAVVSGETSEALGELDNDFKKLKVQTDAAFRSIAEGLAPALHAVSTAFLESENNAAAFNATGELLGGIVTGLAKAATIVAASFKAVGTGIGAAAAEIAAIATGDFAGAMAIDAMATEDFKKQSAALAKTLEDLTVKQGASTDKTKENTEKTKEEIEAQEKLNKQVAAALQTKTAATDAEKAHNKEKERAAELTKAARTDLEIYNDTVDEATKLNEKKLLSDEALNRTIEQAEDVYEKARESTEKMTDAQKEAHQLHLAMRTPLEVFYDEVRRLDELLASGAIKNQEDYNRAIRAAAGALETAQTAADNADKHLQGIDKALDDIANNLPQYAGSVSSTLVDFAFNAKEAEDSFGDMVESVLRDLATMAVQVLTIQPLMEALKKSMQATAAAGGGGIGGFFSGLFSSSQGNAFAGGQVIPHAMGGVMSHPFAFPMAGGKVGTGSEVAPEAIMPLSRDNKGRLGVSGSTAEVTVIVNNNAGAAVQVEQQTGPSGEQVIQVMVERAVETAIGRGKFDNTLQQVYGLQRRGR